MNIRIIEESHLKYWAETPNSRNAFPELMYRLIRETCDDISFISFPSEAGVQKPGFDGILRAKNGYKYFVPKGDSVWELGTDKRYKVKANKDFNKRVLSSDKIIKTSLTFVFVTPREFRGKKEWIEEKENLKIFDKVVVIDRTDIVQWLDDAPNVAYYFAQETIGVLPSTGIEPASFFYEKFTKKRFDVKTIIGGREDYKNIIINNIKNGRDLSIRSYSNEEAIAFILATIKQELGINYFNKVIICKKIESVQQLSFCKKPHLLIAPQSLLGDEIYSLKQQGHQVITIQDHNSLIENNTDSILLTKYHQYDVSNSLIVEAGMPSDLARSKAFAGAGMLHKLRRLIFKNSNKPNWSNKINLSIAIPAMLVGIWNDNDEWQKSFLKDLNVLNYTKFCSELVEFEGEGDLFVYRFKHLWKVQDLIECYSIYYSKILPAQLEKFKDYAILSLTDINPYSDIEVGDFMLAQINGIKPEVNEYVKEGILKSLIAIEHLEGTDNKATSIKEVKNTIIREILLSREEKDIKNICQFIDKIAESAPKLVIDYIKDLINNYPEKIIELFNENKNFALISKSHHVNLLWALEGLASYKNCIDDVIDILIKLHKLDPGGQLSNRPLESISSILSLREISHIEVFKKVELIEEVIEKLPDTYNSILERVLVNNKPNILNRHYFKFGNRKNKEINKITWNQYIELIQKLFPKVVEAEQRCNNKELIKLLYKLSKTSRINYLENLILYQDKIIFDNQFWISLLYFEDFLKNGKKGNRLEEDEKKLIDTLLNICKKNKADDPKYWIFTHECDDLIAIIEEIPLWQDRELINAKVFDLRKATLKKIYKKGIPEILKYFKNEEGIQIILHTLKSILNEDEAIELIIAVLKYDKEKPKRYLEVFVPYYSKEFGFDWIVKTHRKIKLIIPEAELFFLITCYPSSRLWDFIDEIPDIAYKYWLNVHFLLYFDKKEIELRKRGIEKLISVGRCVFALQQLGVDIREQDSLYLVDLLFKIGEAKCIDGGFNSYIIEKIFQKINDDLEIPTHNKAQLEYLYSPLLTSGNISYGIPNLSKLIYQNPKELIQIFSASINSDNTNQEVFLFNIVENINGYPVDSNNKHCETVTRNWVKKIRCLAKENNLLEAIDFVIGGALSRIPTIEYLPFEYVCEIVQEINSSELNQGFLWKGKHSKSTIYSGVNTQGFEEKYDKLLSASRNTKKRFPIISGILLNWANENKDKIDNMNRRKEYDNNAQWY